MNKFIFSVKSNNALLQGKLWPDYFSEKQHKSLKFNINFNICWVMTARESPNADIFVRNWITQTLTLNTW